MVTLVSSIVVALSLADAGRPAPPAPAGGAAAAVSLDVPFVPQTEALCGGAAVAMVMRYWGARHTGVQEFATLVDARAKGIPTDVLVRAIEDRYWQAHEGSGSMERIRTELTAAHPVIVLIADGPRRYHYVVIVGAGAGYVVVHDPAWGPSRRIPENDLVRRWAPARFWSLVILPTETTTIAVRSVRVQPDQTDSACDRLLDDAVARIHEEGFADADAILMGVRETCPASAGPLRELAGIRFAQRRWPDAAALASEAVAIDPHDEYGWEVLASSRFMQDDVAGALRAWNHVGKPRIDAVRIEGLTRTRHALVADALSLPTGAVLTADRFARAKRRLEELPDALGVRLDYRPETDGFARVDVVIVEPPVRPHGAMEWAARGVEAAVDREVSASFPGATGQGETWSASWRWWSSRPRVAISFATPRAGKTPAVWRVDGSWERETYQPGPGAQAVREDRTHGGLTMADWATHNVRYEVTAGLDSWNGTRRAASIGGSIEQRAFGDRFSLHATATRWIPLTADATFDAAAFRATLRSSMRPSGFVWLVEGGLDRATAAAPLSLWMGAGDGHARAPLLRAHPLLEDGILSGSVFGRHLTHTNAEVQRWIGSAPIRFAAASFVDVARASGRLPAAAGDPFQIDAGAGIRIRVPGQKGMLRVDFARGLRDGSHAFTAGWQY